MWFLTTILSMSNGFLAKADSGTMTDNLAELEELQKMAKPGIIKG